MSDAGPRPGPGLPGRQEHGAYPTHREDLAGRVEKALASFLSSQRTRLTMIDADLRPLADAVETFVLHGGKRLRPAFAWWGYRGAGGPDRDEVISAVAALELFQASALIHDDVMDASDTRRGQPSVHRRFATAHRHAGWAGDSEAFGRTSAILIGDLCLAWSDEMLHTSGLDPVQVAQARPAFDEMRTEVTVGQYLDALSQARSEISIRQASTVARYKSAKYTVERPLLIGAALAGAPAGLVRGYSAFGLPLGEAFQLRDDLLGVFGDPEHTGKPAGDDLREGKRTYLVAAALEAADPASQQILLAGLGDAALDRAGQRRLGQLIEDVGARLRTETRIAELTAQALAALANLDLANGAGEVLRELAGAATMRTG